MTSVSGGMNAVPRFQLIPDRIQSGADLAASRRRASINHARLVSGPTAGRMEWLARRDARGRDWRDVGCRQSGRGRVALARLPADYFVNPRAATDRSASGLESARRHRPKPVRIFLDCAGRHPVVARCPGARTAHDSHRSASCRLPGKTPGGTLAADSSRRADRSQQVARATGKAAANHTDARLEMQEAEYSRSSLQL